MAEIKKTKKMYFNELLEIVKGNNELENFISHELELLDKKSENKTPSKNQVENENFKKDILEILVNANEKMSITEIQAKKENLAELSNQKMSALLKQLIDSKLVERITDKKKSYFVAL